jgi:hypothetical protein
MKAQKALEVKLVSWVRRVTRAKRDQLVLLVQWVRLALLGLQVLKEILDHRGSWVRQGRLLLVHMRSSSLLLVVR